MDTNRIMLIVVAIAIVAVLAWYLYPTAATSPTPGAGPTASAPATTGTKPGTTEPKK